MKRLLVLFLLILLCAGAYARPGDQIVLDTVDLDGNSVTDALFADVAVTMINIWGTFCPPCIREMPDLGKLAAAYSGKGFQIVGIPIDVVGQPGAVNPRTEQEAERIIATTGAAYTHIVPTAAMAAGFLADVQVVPTTIFVDSTGHQIGQAYLGSRSYKAWQKIVDALLEVQE